MVDRFQDKETWIDGDGSLISFPDPYKGITPQDALRAEQAQQEIIAVKRQVEMNFFKLAELLDAFDRSKSYLGCGFSSFRLWCGSDSVDLSYRVASDLLRIRRELVPALEAAGVDSQAALMEVGVSKARAALPLLNDEGGEEQAVELLVDSAPFLTWADTRQAVRELQGKATPIDERAPAMFSVKAKKKGETYQATIFGSDGVAYERLGPSQTIPASWWGRWVALFKGNVEVEEDE